MYFEQHFQLPSRNSIFKHHFWIVALRLISMLTIDVAIAMESDIDNLSCLLVGQLFINFMVTYATTMLCAGDLIIGRWFETVVHYLHNSCKDYVELSHDKYVTKSRSYRAHLFSLKNNNVQHATESHMELALRANTLYNAFKIISKVCSTSLFFVLSINILDVIFSVYYTCVQFLPAYLASHEGYSNTYMGLSAVGQIFISLAVKFI